MLLVICVQIAFVVSTFAAPWHIQRFLRGLTNVLQIWVLGMTRPRASVRRIKFIPSSRQVSLPNSVAVATTVGAWRSWRITVGFRFSLLETFLWA